MRLKTDYLGSRRCQLAGTYWAMHPFRLLPLCLSLLLPPAASRWKTQLPSPSSASSAGSPVSGSSGRLTEFRREIHDDEAAPRPDGRAAPRPDGQAAQRTVRLSQPLPDPTCHQLGTCLPPGPRQQKGRRLDQGRGRCQRDRRSLLGIHFLSMTGPPLVPQMSEARMGSVWHAWEKGRLTGTDGPAILFS